MTTPPTLQAIKERDAQCRFTPQSHVVDDGLQAGVDRRHLLNLVERMRPYVEWAHDHCDPEAMADAEMEYWTDDGDPT